MDNIAIYEKIKAFNKNQPKAYFISTFGCQMNAHDSEKLAGMLLEMGYSPAGDEKSADIVVYNTCCVRENAENKVYGHLGFLKHQKKERPDLKIVLCGCMMQQEHVLEVIRAKHRHVDIVFGTFNLHKFPMLLQTNLETGKMVTDIWKEQREFDGSHEEAPTVREEKYKAGVNIMYGCDNFCSYCIVPYVRGRERSREPEEILAEIEALSKDGVREIMLLGQNVNSYGKSLNKPLSFAGLLKRIVRIDGIERIRFMTPHPKDLSDELIYTIRDEDKICKHIHLPVQAGSSRILALMNRKYDKDGYLNLVRKIRENIPNVAITTDIIVGFPGETEDDFAETLDVVRHSGFSGAYTFIYSKRVGTPAAKMDGHIDEGVISERFGRLISEVNAVILAQNESLIGKTVKVLAEGKSPENPEYLTGHSDDFRIVHFPAPDEILGKTIDVKITGCKTFYLVGEPAQ